MTKTRVWSSIVLGLILTAAAFGQTAYTAKAANLRAGPSRDYPLVVQVEAGAPVRVMGCVDDWTWCDVVAGPDRGWMYSGNLSYPYQGRRVIILNSGTFIGLPIVTFSVGPYWDTYYRARPWYGRRGYWIGRPPPPRRPWVGPRPPVHRPPAVRPLPPRPRPPANRAPVRPAPRPRRSPRAGGGP